jgi:hypothetical protein
MQSNPLKSISYALWDFKSPRGENLIVRWAIKNKLGKLDRAKLNQRFDRLKQVDFDLALKTSLLNGPVVKDVYKMKANGQVMMRPLLCRGPFVDEEYTLLIGAIEKDWELDPSTALTDAQSNRNELLADKSRREPHVRF